MRHRRPEDVIHTPEVLRVERIVAHAALAAARHAAVDAADAAGGGRRLAQLVVVRQRLVAEVRLRRLQMRLRRLRRLRRLLLLLLLPRPPSSR